jgi:hypothetical protein
MLSNGYVRWLVLYFKTQTGRFNRQAYYCSPDLLQTLDVSSVPKHQAAVIATFDAQTHKCVGSAAQSLRSTFIRTCVVGAAVSPARRTLVVAMRVPGAPEDDNSGPYFRFQPICLTSWSVNAPAFDVVDWSLGKAAPVFCLRNELLNFQCLCTLILA